MNYLNIDYDSSEDNVDPNIKKDVLLRIHNKPNKPEEIEISSFDFSSIQNKFCGYMQSWLDVIKTLSYIIKRQKKMMEYKDYYISFLHGLIEEEEFDEIEKGFVIEKTDQINQDVLKNKISCLMSATNLSYTTSELSDLFLVNSDIVNDAMESITYS